MSTDCDENSRYCKKGEHLFASLRTGALPLFDTDIEFIFQFVVL